MRRIVWTGEARDNLRDITAYIAAFNPHAARKLAVRLIETAEKLKHFPERGRDVGTGIRQMSIVRPYLLRYRVEEDTVYILRIRHGARLQDDA